MSDKIEKKEAFIIVIASILSAILSQSYSPSTDLFFNIIQVSMLVSVAIVVIGIFVLIYNNLVRNKKK